jgi:predicted translin family RNA/ssDNA-binding protein
MSPRSTEERSGTREEAEKLAREITRDAVAAARRGWHVAHRVGRAAFRGVEQALEELSKELE